MMPPRCLPRFPLLLLFALLLTLAQAATASAQTAIDQKAIDKAHNFFITAERGRAVMGFVHFGAAYKGHNYRAEDNGKVTALGQPGHFALIYRFQWENDGLTEIAFDCDSTGRFYGLRVLKTNAVLQQPFTLANGSIKLVGNLIIEAFREKMSEAEIQEVRRYIDNPNARALLEINLKLQQTFGR